jgi:hypothetical protein
MLVAVLVQGADIAAAAETSGKPPKDGMRVTGDRDLPMTLVVLPWLEPAVTLPPALMQSGLPQVFERDRSLVQDPLNRSVAVLQMAKQEAVDQAQVLEAEKEAAAKKRRRRSRSDGDE